MAKLKKTIKVLVRILILGLVVMLIVALPAIEAKSDDNLLMIYHTFLGNKSEFQGVLEIWNIDTFESGSASKQSFLESTAKRFQKQNKGVFVMTRNMTEFECLNLLSRGEKPDLFSCSYNVAEKLRDYLMPFDENLSFDTAQNFLDAGKIDGKQFAVAWCRGSYCLISTREKLEKAEKYILGKNAADGQPLSEQVLGGTKKLSDIALSMGYEVEGKTKTKKTYSLTFGGNSTLPQKAFEAYTDKGLVSTSDRDIDAKSPTQSAYSAYCNFLADGSVILLGTQRDIIRVQGRVDAQKLIDAIFEPLLGFTDLVQFAMPAKSDDALRAKYAQKFVQLISCKNNQDLLYNIGMFATCNSNSADKYSGVMFDIASEKIEDLTVLNLF